MGGEGLKLYNVLLPVVILALAFSCNGQSGPTKPSAALSWTQSTTSGVTANCVYRGSVAGVYTFPALFCSTVPITTYTDNSVLRGVTYHYAVTAQQGSVEGGYSNDALVPVPTAPNAPTGLNPATVTKLLVPPQLTAKVIWEKR